LRWEPKKDFDEYLSSSVTLSIGKEAIMNTGQHSIQTSVSQRLIIKALRIKQFSTNNTAGSSPAIVSLFMILLLITLASIDVSAGLIDNIKEDMQMNEAVLLYATPSSPPWTRYAHISMGGAPRGDATPNWWTPANTNFKSSTPWKVAVPWFVIYPGVSHKATNVRVKVYGITLYILKKSTNKWIRVDNSFGDPTWAQNINFNLGGLASSTVNTRKEPDGRLSYKLDGSLHPIHGGTKKQDLISLGINPSDVAAVFSQVKTQLILDNPSGVDDRASAQLLLSVGADYYPDMTTKISDYSPMTQAPPVAMSRFGLIKTVPRTHYLATIDPPGASESSEYLSKGGVVAIPVNQFEANMPPYLFDITAPSAPTALSLIFNAATPTAWASNNLSWHISTDNIAVTGYNVYKNGKLIAKTASNNYKDSFPTAGTGTTYKYSIRAFDSAGNLSASSNVVETIY